LAERGGGGVQDAFTRCPTGRVAAARLWAAGSRSVPGGSHHAPPSSADGGSVVRRRKPTTHSVYGSECDSLPITRGSSTCPWVPVHRSRGERRRFPRTPADPGPRRTVRDRGESSVRQPLGPLPIEIRTSALLLRW